MGKRKETGRAGQWVGREEGRGRGEGRRGEDMRRETGKDCLLLNGGLVTPLICVCHFYCIFNN